MLTISVLGCGRWGSFIAWYLDKIGHRVTLWGRQGSPHLQEIQETHTNGMLTFPDSIRLTDDLGEAVTSARVIIISISAQRLRSFMQTLPPEQTAGKTIVLCMKGIETGTGCRLSQIASACAPDAKIAIWVGPGHPQDFNAGIPNCMVIDSDDEETKRFLIGEFTSKLIRFYIGRDLIGNEIGAAAKNTMGIAAGMLDGMNLVSLKGALMSRGTREISRLIKAMGGNELSAYGLCHLGDYQATLFSPYSHNRQFGEAFVKGEKFDKLAEGVDTTKALVKLGEQYHVDLPICCGVNRILSGEETAREVLSDLFLRSIKSEI
ncbi:MAG: NAD(P)H-dependent glycerol-3-phosphate dehydrogenase [Lachnospiraceae bacterium]|jgi:glycerol-3-phosphate dehydrogenase (NAD(P)+)